MDRTPAVLPDAQGNFQFVEGDLPQAPTVSVNFLGRYTWRMPGGSLSRQVDGFVYGDHYLYGAKNEANSEDRFGVLNASVSYATADGRWKVPAWCKNLTDSVYRIYLLDLGLAGFLEEIYGPPRWFGSSISYSF